MRPDGRRASVTIDRPAEIEAEVERLRAVGAKFEIEVLRTGHVSLEILADNPSEPDEPHCLVHTLVPNGPEVPIAVDASVECAVREAKRLGLIP